jgi:hypothetical protein
VLSKCAQQQYALPRLMLLAYGVCAPLGVVNQFEALFIAFPRFCTASELVGTMQTSCAPPLFSYLAPILMKRRFYGPVQLPPGSNASSEQKWREKKQEGSIDYIFSDLFMAKGSTIRGQISTFLAGIYEFALGFRFVCYSSESSGMKFDSAVYSKAFLDMSRDSIAECNVPPPSPFLAHESSGAAWTIR